MKSIKPRVKNIFSYFGEMIYGTKCYYSLYAQLFFAVANCWYIYFEVMLVLREDLVQSVSLFSIKKIITLNFCFGRRIRSLAERLKVKCRNTVEGVICLTLYLRGFLMHT